MAIRHRIFSFLMLVLMMVASSCAVIESESIKKIALLAPFEGRYREIGYNALYAVRLALKDSGMNMIQLLATDDGGTIPTAIDRIRALNMDPSVEAIIALGEIASHIEVQAVNDKPLLIVGFWGQLKADDQTYIVSHREIGEQVTTVQPITELDLETALVGGDLYMLEQMPDLYPNLDNLTVISGGTPPEQDFRERYVNSDLYVPEPNLLASLMYDVTGLVIESLTDDIPLDDIVYTGINGQIQFVDGYWQDAPLHRYQYDDQGLITIND